MCGCVRVCAHVSQRNVSMATHKRACEQLVLTVVDEPPIDEIWRRISVDLAAYAERTALDDRVLALEHAHSGHICARARAYVCINCFAAKQWVRSDRIMSNGRCLVNELVGRQANEQKSTGTRACTHARTHKQTATSGQQLESPRARACAKN